MDKCLLSIIVPIYNVRTYLEKCIESIINQTYTNLEIILINDGSTDGCAQICDEFAKKDKRIKVIHKENEGIVRTRQCGLKNANGKYIGWVDGDDWIEPDMYDQLMDKALEFDCDIVMSGRIEEYIHESKYLVNKCEAGYYSKSEIVSRILPHMLYNRKGEEFDIFPTVWDKVFKRNILERVLPYIPENIRVGDDVACVYPSILIADSIYILDACLYHYIKYRNESLTHVNDLECFTRIRALQNYLHNIFRRLDYSNNMQEQLNGYIWSLAEGSIVKEFHVRNPYKRCFVYQFPYNLVPQGACIILYGAGGMGKELWCQLKENKYCDVVAWTDKNWKAYGIDSNECIKCMDYDYIIVSVVKKEMADEIVSMLVEQGVSKEKIIWAINE